MSGDYALFIIIIPSDQAENETVNEATPVRL